MGQVREAHDAAVRSVLSHMEEHYCHYRSPEGIRCGGMASSTTPAAHCNWTPAVPVDRFENRNPASKFALQRVNGEPPRVVVAGEKIRIKKKRGAQVVLPGDEATSGPRQAERLLDVAEELRHRGPPGEGWPCWRCRNRRCI
ncbi:hypothetical protein KP004_05575 [Geomonas oryzisoli]|uniref:Uncharacterized protein n=1 Tax=Geomonas oryzisoli TaxID=2847992 RepID=A0ABX8JB86_9BACT|nr:hypothetical protein KP004_05575 [Geomonas oryzisoli]